MTTPLTFLDELERAFPELGDEVGEARARFNSTTVAVDVYGWVSILGGLLDRALDDEDPAMLQRCFDFLELLYRGGHRQVLMAVAVRIFDAMDSPELRVASEKYAGPYTLMAQKFDAEGIARD